MTRSTELSESPFLNVRSFELPTATVARLGLSSPFVESFAFEETDPGAEPHGAIRRILLAELYDEELDDAIYEVVGEIAAQGANGAGSTAAAFAARQRIAPLADEIERFIQRAADAFGPRDAATFTDSEIDDVMSRIGRERQLSPAFEQLFGGIKKALSKVAKGAVSLAKKGIQVATTLGLGPLLEKLKKFVRPLLERVLKAAISRLPVAVQPAARTLAAKLPTLFGMEVEPIEGEAALDTTSIQSEFNEQVADVLLGETDVESNSEASGWREPGPESEAGIADLDAARDRFVAELAQLEDGGDPGPAVERFIPALLPALKLGLSIVGRPRVVKLLADLVSKLIAKVVGPASSGALSTALVDAGLKLIGLEVSDGDQRRAAHAAIASTVEETVRSVAALPDSVLDNETLLEGSIVRAFENAAASNLPPVLPESVYRQRPELSETDTRRGAWVTLPIRGPKRYKKFSRVLRTRITPRVAMTVTTFGEAPLAQYLQEQLGFEPGEELDANVHLYEALPGTVLGEVAQLESNGNGVASTAEFHPLTQEAAALLMHEPGLGRTASPASLSAPRNLAVGQRFYRVAVPGRRVAVVSVPGAAKGRPRKRTCLQTVLDFPGDKIRLYLFLAERRAQEFAAALRKQGHAGAIATTLKSFIDRGVAAAMDGNITGRVRIVHEALSLDEARGAALNRLPKAAVKAFAARIGEWTASALTDYLSAQSAQFISATEDAQDGVTVIVTIANPPGMAAIRKGIAGASPNGASAAGGAPASVQVEVIPGFKNG